MKELTNSTRVELGSRIIGNRRCRDQKEGKQIERRFIQLGMSTQVSVEVMGEGESDKTDLREIDPKANTPFQEV